MSNGKPLMDVDVIDAKITAPGQASFITLNGTLTTDPAFQSWDNDLGSGSITMNTRRTMSLQDSQETLCNFSQFVGGTAHWQSGGGWFDTGTPFGHTGVAQNNAAATNDEYFALISQYPDRDDGEPIFNPLPTMDDILNGIKNVTGVQESIKPPTLKSFYDTPEFLGKMTAYTARQQAANVEAQAKMAAQKISEHLEEQIADQKRLLVEQYGEELYNLYFRARVEAGYVFIKPELPYSTTKDDLYQALFANGKADRRNSHLAKM